MIRGIALSMTCALLAASLGGCGGGGGKSGKSESDRPSTGSAAPPASATTPTEPPPYTSTAGPAVVDACSLIPASSIAEHLGAHPTIITSSTSEFEDPHALDCTWIGPDMRGDAQVTTRPERDLSEAEVATQVRNFPSAQEVTGADWGWAYGGSGGGAFIVMVKGNLGLQFSIDFDNAEHDSDDVQRIAQEVLERLTATTA